MSGDLTGVWRGTITNQVSSVCLATAVVTFEQTGISLSGSVILKDVLPPSSKEERRSLRGEFLDGVQFIVLNTPIGDVQHSGSLSEDGKKISGSWEAEAHLYVSYGRFELIRDVTDGSAESIEATQRIKDLVPV